jgi:hypothetical protein
MTTIMMSADTVIVAVAVVVVEVVALVVAAALAEAPVIEGNLLQIQRVLSTYKFQELGCT